MAPLCLPAGNIDAQVSNDQVAGQTIGTVLAADGTTAPPLSVLGASVVGTGDPTPIGTAIAHTGAGVDRVRLTVPGSGTDEMQPKDGYVVLARGVAGLTPADLPAVPQVPANGGATTPASGLDAKQAPTVVPSGLPVGLGFPAGSKVEALDASGKVLATVDLPSWQPITAKACPMAGVGISAGQSSAASVGTAIAGSAVVGSSGAATAAKP